MAIVITESGGNGRDALNKRARPIASTSTPTVSTNHNSTLYPVTSRKLGIWASGHMPVITK